MRDAVQRDLIVIRDRRRCRRPNGGNHGCIQRGIAATKEN